MKRLIIITLALSVLLISTGCNQKQGSSSITSSLSSSDFAGDSSGSDTSSSEVSSSDPQASQVPSTDTTSSAVSSGSSSNTPSGGTDPGQNPSGTTPEKDTDRHVSNDLGSFVADGYVYYSNSLSGMDEGIYKKSIGLNQSTVKIIEKTGSSIQAYNGHLYYIADFGKIWRSDLNGANEQLIDGGYYTEMWVAGKWIFALASSYTGGGNTRLVMMKPDGTQKVSLQPDTVGAGDAVTKAVVYGFNRGYCYYYVENKRNTDSSPDGIQAKLQRIDYRSDKPVAQDLPSYFSEMAANGGVLKVSNDRVLFKAGNKYCVRNLLNDTTTELLTSGAAFSNLLLKDYFVYNKNELNNVFSKNTLFVFVNAVTKQQTEIPIIAGEDESNIRYTLYDQEEYNSNNLYVIKQYEKQSHSYYELLKITPNSEAQSIYKVLT